MKLVLDPGENDWTFGTVIESVNYDERHNYRYMFIARRGRYYMPDGSPNDRGFWALCLGCPECSGCRDFDHDRVGKAWSSYGGLPGEGGWREVVQNRPE